MTIWLVEYSPLIGWDLDDTRGLFEMPRFRIVPESEAERWIAMTNEKLPPELQEEAALIMAEALSKAMWR